MRQAPIAALFVLALAACDTGSPARPGNDDRGAPTTSIGTSPLRRLSNVEYLNALRDLFPLQHPTLPALPADIPVAGFENAAEGQRPSDVLVSRYEAIASLYAEAATTDVEGVRTLVGCSNWSTSGAALDCANTFFTLTGTRIFRRPLTNEEHDRFLSRFQDWQAAIDFEGAVQLTLSAMLQSPQFLYRAEPVPKDAPAAGPAGPGNAVVVDAYAMASRLSFFLWESIPDDALLDDARRGALGTEDEVRTAATRMLADDRAQRIFWDFPRQWLGLDRIALPEHSTRTADPQWTTATQASAAKEVRLFVQNVLVDGGTLTDLMTSRRAWVDGEMARVYGLPAPAKKTSFTEVLLPEAERAGLLTRASFLAGYSHAGGTSPPVRGNGIQLRFLCQLPRSPPPSADLSQPMAAPGAGPKTNRMLFEARTSPFQCQTCHTALNGFGFGFESYDAAGHFQTSENGLAIDPSGTIIGTDVDGPYQGAIELSKALSRSSAVHDCATAELVRYALGRAPAGVELPVVRSLARDFLKSGGDLRELILSVVTTPSFRMRLVESETP